MLDRIKSAWNVFRNYDKVLPYQDYGPGYTARPDRIRMYLGTERSILSSIYNRIGIDVAAISMFHARVDQNGRFLEIINSGLNNCITTEANIDQSGRAFIQDIVMSMCDEGAVAVVPVDTTINPNVFGSYEILTMRTAKIIEWYPEHVRVNLYNQRTGLKQDITLSKTTVAIIENPLYSVMNEPNSTLKRLIDKLNILDAIDKQSGSGKIDLIVQLPYVVKTPKRQEQANQRRIDIENQLQDSRYGVAYIDGTEHVTQLNRPAENNLMGQIEFLTSMLYGQLGLTKEIFDGNADEEAMLNYHNRTIEPMVSAITDGLKRVFLTKTARSQGQTVLSIRDPFKLMTAEKIAELADKLTRNEIASANEMRAVIGWKPSSDPKADELRNKNINPTSNVEETKEDNQNERKMVNNEKRQV